MTFMNDGRCDKALSSLTKWDSLIGQDNLTSYLIISSFNILSDV